MTDDALLDAVRIAAKALIAAGYKVSYHTIRRHDPRIMARYGRIWAALDKLIEAGGIPAESRSRRGERGGFERLELPPLPSHAPEVQSPRAEPSIPDGDRGVYARAMRDIFGRDWLRMYRGTRGGVS